MIPLETNMAMMEKESQIVILLAKAFFELADRVDSKWSKAFFRFEMDNTQWGSKGSVVAGPKVDLVDPFVHKDRIERMNSDAVSLFRQLGKAKGVLLLTLEASLNYDVKFEFENMGRWQITKLNGDTGIPQGL
jgi:hypothetical protein